ncbi:hypothetical protein L3V82_00440 [Thiotrichales bacterium 19S3-7]|nr:hypothetical protein [Thiotrichales bacterium 19S3-7]MCF6800631.1 hypothetical protein [Thiotrichales bacterium 19S3-11]
MLATVSNNTNNEGTTLLYHGFLIKDLKTLKEQCPKTIDAPFFCRVLFFINLKNIDQVYKKVQYTLRLIAVSPKKLKLVIIIDNYRQKDELLVSVVINQVDSHKLLEFVQNIASILVLDTKLENYLMDAYFSDFKLSGHLALPLSLFREVHETFKAYDINEFDWLDSYTLRLDHIKTDDHLNEKQIAFEFDFSRIIKGNAEVSFFMPDIIYAQPILASLDMNKIKHISFQNQVNFDYLSLNVNEFLLVEPLPETAKAMVLSMLQDRIKQYTKTQYQTHNQDFLSALSRYFLNPKRFQALISAKYSFHQSDDIWHYFVRLIANAYVVSLYKANSDSINRSGNFNYYKQAKHNLLKYKLRLKHFYRKELQFEYVINQS